MTKKALILSKCRVIKEEQNILLNADLNKKIYEDVPFLKGRSNMGYNYIKLLYFYRAMFIPTLIYAIKI